MMKKICCIFVASFLVISMTIPMVFAGALPQQSEEVVDETRSSQPVRAVSQDMYLQESAQYFEFHNTDTPPFTFYIYGLSSYSAVYFRIPRTEGLGLVLSFYDESANLIYTSSVSFTSSYQRFLIPRGASYLCLSRDSSVGNYTCYFYGEYNNTDLYAVYDLFYSSGVNEEWSSIGVVIFALLPIVTIWLIIGRVFKGKKS